MSLISSFVRVIYLLVATSLLVLSLSSFVIGAVPSAATSRITTGKNEFESNLSALSSPLFRRKPLLPSDTMVVQPNSFSGTSPCPHNQSYWVCTVTLSLFDPSSINRNWMASGGDGNVSFAPISGTLNENNPKQQVTFYILLTICSTSYTLYFSGNVNEVTVSWSCEKTQPKPTPSPSAKSAFTPTVTNTPTARRTPSPTPKVILTPSTKDSSMQFDTTRTPFQENRITSVPAESDPQSGLPLSTLGIYLLLSSILAFLIILCILIRIKYSPTKNKQI